MEHLKTYIENETSNEKKEVIVSYDITYDDFRTELLKYLDKGYSYNRIDESTYQLVRTLTDEGIETLTLAIRTKFEAFKGKLKLNENEGEKKKVSIQLIIPNDNRFDKRIVIDEIVE